MAPDTIPNDEFESMLTGGHPNSLGRTLEVVDIVLADRSRLADLYSCYFSDDEVVRLRVSNAMKRVTLEQPDWVVPFVDPLLDEVAGIHQASTQWTLAILFQLLWDRMSTSQRDRAKELVMSNLEEWDDWIVLNNSMEALAEWSSDDPELAAWLLPQLQRLESDERRSVSNRARKLLDRVDA